MAMGAGVFRCCGASGLMPGAIDALGISLPWLQALESWTTLYEEYAYNMKFFNIVPSLVLLLVKKKK
jgi:hypothetical protein